MSKPTKVRLYSTSTCPWCKMEKAWLEQNNVDFEFVLVDHNPHEAEYMVRSTKQMGVPVTEFRYGDGQPEFVIGFNQPVLASKLGLA